MQEMNGKSAPNKKTNPNTSNVSKMYVHFLHSELYKKYMKLKGTAPDKDPALEGIEPAHFFEKKYRPYIYTEYNGVTFAIPLCSTCRAQYHGKINTGREKPSYMSFSCVVPVPKEYLPKGDVIQILENDTITFKNKPHVSGYDIMQRKELNENRAEYYRQTMNYLKYHSKEIQKQLVRFLSDYAKCINYTNESRAVIHSLSVLRYFEEDESVMKACNQAFYQQNDEFPSNEKLKAKIPINEKEKYERQYNEKKENKARRDKKKAEKAKEKQVKDNMGTSIGSMLGDKYAAIMKKLTDLTPDTPSGISSNSVKR